MWSTSWLTGSQTSRRFVPYTPFRLSSQQLCQRWHQERGFRAQSSERLPAFFTIRTHIRWRQQGFQASNADCFRMQWVLQCDHQCLFGPRKIRTIRSPTATPHTIPSSAPIMQKKRPTPKNITVKALFGRCHPPATHPPQSLRPGIDW